MGVNTPEPGQNYDFSKDLLKTDAPLPAAFTWLNRLKKNELVEITGKHGLAQYGTMAELKQRIENYFLTGQGQRPTLTIEGKPIEQQSGNQSDQIPLMTPAQTCTTVRKWNVRFDAKGDPISFLERVEELKESYHLTDSALLSALPEILTDEPLSWYRNNKTTWTCWGQFIRSFREQFVPEDNQFRLGAAILNKRHSSEPVLSYITDMLTLMRRYGRYSAAEQAEIIHLNLRPEYKIAIRRRDFGSPAELINLVRETDRVLKETRQASRNIPVLAIQETGTNPPERPRGPERPVRPDIPPNVSAPRDIRGTRCFRCGATDHWQENCQKPWRLCCSRCGRGNTTSRECPCKTGAGNEGGRRG